MCCFPKDKERRNQWTKCLNKPNWTPTDHSVLCEKHFAPVMWEKTRVDGKKKLRSTAIPTLFEVPDAQTVVTRLVTHCHHNDY
ncbi:THAP domain-containing protein 4 [Cyphomyrmex costatus]|uniref:THAP domain-containing protein 4 n=1 Tax=Cyphomyrmex costatus TaxID=456900 RepID=A0A151IIG9_9HYME|nr:THAP domain-containing protein 4 [Cyphomyrmex costatus]